MTTGPPGTQLYLDLLKGALTREIWLDDDPGRNNCRELRVNGWKGQPVRLVQRALSTFGYQIVAETKDANLKDLRRTGSDWPEFAETMIGRLRLDNLHQSIERVLDDGIPGDLIETGVWRGGAVIFMRAALKAHGVTDRSVWVADSFEGLPPATLDIDRPDDLSGFADLAIDLETVRANFKRYGLLDDQVKFVKGWFKDTLPIAPIDRLALLRLDGDYYESTWDALDALYPKLAPGGIVIVDDYGLIHGCRKAVDKYRALHHVVEPIERIDHTGVWWRKA